ncbi:hypothetical protein Y032_0054g2439 [Ancylostoma ceylanicum]|uniref:Protein kinase domain-containing protein n=1 Tax=Ancylostoma ceylanicum TaxID=53326 RepID=A0A016U613_9BILA|nr:hypothetical protein Y032_0054g2439 [Ancylostoma ceylanicum]
MVPYSVTESKFLHSHKYVHRDIKLTNLCIGSGQFSTRIFLIDYGDTVKHGKKIRYGTPDAYTLPYWSLDAHKRLAAREKGDAESWFYVLVDLKNVVAIAIAGTLEEHVLFVDWVSDKLISVRIATDEGFLTVISVHAPQCGCSEADKMAFYDELDEAIRGAPESDYLTSGRDFNGNVGQDRKGVERVHGERGFGIRYQDGDRIVDMAEAHDLVIANRSVPGEEVRINIDQS